MLNKIAIIGASGFIGHHLKEYLCSLYENIITPSQEELDITKFDDWCVFLTKEQPDFLILLAGSKDVKTLEKDAGYAHRINTQPVLDYIRVIEENNLKTKLIYFSSDYVFDGIRGNYTSSDIPNPCTNYGKSKLKSEIALKNSKVQYKIIRTSAVMGEGGVFYEWLVNAIRTEDKIDMFENVCFTPTQIKHLLQMLNTIIINYDSINKDTLHLVGKKSYTRYEYALELKNTIKNAKAKINKVQLDIVHSTFCKNLTMVCDDIDNFKEWKNEKSGTICNI